MNSKVITIDNWNDLNKEVENIQNTALLAGASFGTHVYITGEKALERFLNEYAPAARIEGSFSFRNDGKTSAVSVPYIVAEIQGDSRSERGIVCADCYYTVHYFVLYKGQYYNWNKKDTFGTGNITLNDDPIYSELRHYLPNDWEKTHPAPNKVGTITDAKMDEWIKWLDERRAAALAVRDERREGVSALMARLNQMDPTQFDKFKVSPNEGTIVKNGLEFTYKVEEDGNIRQSIKVHYSAGRDLDAFLKMAAGTYKPTEKIY